MKCLEPKNKCLVTYVKDAASEYLHFFFLCFPTALLNLLPEEYERAYVPIKEML